MFHTGQDHLSTSIEPVAVCRWAWPCGLAALVEHNAAGTVSYPEAGSGPGDVAPWSRRRTGSGGGAQMSLPDPVALHEAYERELSELLEAVLAGDLMSDRAALERQVVPVVGALVWLQRRHRVDQGGKCSICRAASRAWWRLWPRRSMCTVHTALSFHLRPLTGFGLTSIADQPRRANVRGEL